MATFADRLRSLRMKSGMTQKEVADKLDISESAYGFYEQGRRQPPQEAYTILAELFGVSLDYLILGKSNSISSSVTAQEAEFLKWVEENLTGSFFYDFSKSPETQKEEMMETLRMVWELERKKAEKRNRKDEPT